MPKLVKLYITHVFIGFAVAALFVGALLYFNIANLGHLIGSSDIGWLALTILWVANGIVFSGVQLGIQVMRMADDDSDDAGGKRDDLPCGAVAAPAVAHASERKGGGGPQRP